jgi:nickel transport protein
MNGQPSRGTLALATMLCWAFAGGFAHAHGLEGEVVVRPGWQVQVESWFETGDAAGGARVEVFRANGSLLTEGKLNDQGIWLFSYREFEPLRIVIRAGGGHRKEVQLSAEKLIRQGVCSVVACVTPVPSPGLAAALLVPVESRVASPAPESVVRRESGTQWTRLLIGVGALLAVATVAIQWRRSKAR